MQQRIIYLSFILLTTALCVHSAFAQINVTNETVSSSVTLVWEAQTYVPPFYKGKALLPDGADVKMLAFPPSALGNPYQLSYTWKVDGTVIEDASGPGRSFFVYNSNMFGGAPLIVVEVSRNGQKVAVGAIRVPQVKPRILLYPSLPLAGILFSNQAKATEGAEITLEAYPLFFGVGSKFDPDLTYKWSVDGKSAQNPLGNSGRIVVRSERGGSATLSLNVYNEENVLENADGTITLTFEE